MRVPAGIATTLIAAVIVVGCSSTAGTPPVDQVAPSTRATVAAVPTVGTGGQLIPVASSNAAAAGYDDATRTMFVQFHGGEVYAYYDVEPQLWLDFIAAQPHPWSAVGYPRLVKGGYAYERIS